MARTGNIFSTSDFSRKSGDMIAEALRRPVTITQRNKPRLVLLNIEDYERLKRQADSRMVGTLETMPSSLLDEVEQATEAYAQDDESSRS
jgi:prevent-host-death family protein